MTRTGALVVTAAFMVFVLAITFAQSQADRVTFVHSQRAGCERNTADRSDDARAWASAADRERLLARVERGVRSVAHARSARQAQAAADAMRTRTRPTREGRRAFCRREYPVPSVLPFLD